MVGRAKMSPSLASTGVFPKSAASESGADGGFGKLRYRTTNMREMPWRVPTEKETGENFLGIHYMGKRANKYMDYQRSRAPLLSDTACTTRSSYVQQPLGDHGANRAAALLMKDSSSGSIGGAVGSKPAVPKSSYGAAFARCTVEDMRSAKSSNAKPVRGPKPLSAVDTLMETSSHAHATFSPPAALRLSASSWNQPTTLGPVARGPFPGDAELSLYQKDFTRSLQRPRSVLQLENTANNSLVRCRTPDTGQLESPAEAATRFERTRRAEGLQLRQVFKEDLEDLADSLSRAPSNATSGASRASSAPITRPPRPLAAWSA